MATADEQLARARENVSRARAERAADKGPRAQLPDEDTRSMSEDEERERSERPR